MSKSTGNFLTLRQAIDKFSADGKFSPPLPSPTTILSLSILTNLTCTATEHGIIEKNERLSTHSDS